MLKRPLIALSLTTLLTAACGAAGSNQPEAPPPPRPEFTCEAADARPIAVAPFGNKTKQKAELAGADDLVSNAMISSRCFTLLERENIKPILAELALCDPDNPDRDKFDCGTFPERGKLLGAKVMVFGNLIFFEPNVKGAELTAAVPGIAGVEATAEYSAVAIEVHATDVQTAKKLGSSVVHASMLATKAGLSGGAMGFELGTEVHSKTPMGTALQGMIQDAVRELKGQLDSAAAAN